MSKHVTVSARPEPMALDPAQTAVIVVDMQNAFASQGGYLDIIGFDRAGAPAVVRNISRVLAASRPAGMTVVYLQMGWWPDLHDAGGPDSPNWHKLAALRLMRERPDLDGKLLIRNTWDYAFVDDLKPQPGDLIVPKARYSGFAHTNLDMLLRNRGVRTLVFTGISINVCVESTLRDAFFLEYFPLLIADGTLQSGPPMLHQATVFNVERFFGWVTSTEEYVASLQGVTP